MSSVKVLSTSLYLVPSSFGHHYTILLRCCVHSKNPLLTLRLYSPNQTKVYYIDIIMRWRFFGSLFRSVST